MCRETSVRREAGGEARGGNVCCNVADCSCPVVAVPVPLVPGVACRARQLAVVVVTLPPCAPYARCNPCRQLAATRTPVYIGLWAHIRNVTHRRRGHVEGADEALRVCAPARRCLGCQALAWPHDTVADLDHWLAYADAFHAAHGYYPDGGPADD